MQIRSSSNTKDTSPRPLCWRDRGDHKFTTGILEPEGDFGFLLEIKEFDKLYFEIGQHDSAVDKREDHDWVGPQIHRGKGLLGVVCPSRPQERFRTFPRRKATVWQTFNFLLFSTKQLELIGFRGLRRNTQ
jgi:hypothetical protein